MTMVGSYYVLLQITQERVLQIQGSKMLAVWFKALPKVIVIGNSVESLIVCSSDEAVDQGRILLYLT
jgi:hypothetical protein